MPINTENSLKSKYTLHTRFVRNMLVVTVILMWVCCAQSATLPSTFKRCNPKKSDFNECLKESVQDAFRQLAPGLPSLNVPPVDPMVIPSITISTGSPSVNVIQRYKNYTSYGFKDTVLEKVNADIDEGVIELQMILPNFTIEAQYDFSGRVLVLPISGKGPCKMICVDAKAACTMKTKQYTKKERKHMRVEDVHCTLQIDNVKLQFGNLFGGDERLSSVFNRMIESNSKEIFKDVSQSYADTYAVIAKDFANRIFSKVPMEEIFLSGE